MKNVFNIDYGQEILGTPRNEFLGGLFVYLPLDTDENEGESRYLVLRLN